jgi:tRNA-specific adenosine deaminase 2
MSRIISNNEKLYFMNQALLQGTLALNSEEIPVGCVIVNNDNNEILSYGYNKTNETRNGTRHAEMMAIDDIIIKKGLDPSILSNCELYVTCEPCIMCAAALAKVGIKKVYFGCHNERFGGNGSIMSIHKETRMNNYHSYEVETGLLEEETINLFQKFYTTENRRAPENKRRKKEN